MNDSESAGVRFFLKTALIVLAGWGVFSPAFHGDWLWDDATEITQNLTLRDPSGLWKIWFAPAGLDYFPLKTTAQWAQWHLWQNHPFGYHLTSIGLHLLSALLLWRLFKKLGLRLAWFGGLLFAIHPAVVESVAWMSELKNTLSLPPLLLAMCAWLDYNARKRRMDYLRSLLLFLAAMLCKSSVVMFPVILLLYAWWKRGRITGADLKAVAPFFAISLALGLVTVWFQHHQTIVAPVEGFSPRLAGAGFAIIFYFTKCALPAGLLPIYPRWTIGSSALIQFLPWLVIGAALCGLWTRRATWGCHALFGLGCFLINLAPALGFITMSYMRVSWVADHFVYLPLVSLIGLATGGAGRVSQRLTGPMRASALLGMAMIFGLLAFQSRRYAAIFRSEETLWTYTVRRNPDAWLAHNDLGLALARTGRAGEAVRHYEEALRTSPDLAEMHINLGNALLMLGRASEALQHYEEALRLQPGSVEAHNDLAGALFQSGRLPEAIRHYEEAVRLQPDYVEAHHNLGIALLQAGRVPEAIGHYEKVLRLQPGYIDVRLDLANALFLLNRTAEAVGQYQEALRLQPDSAEAHYNWGNALLKMGRITEAVMHYEEAVRLKPDYANAHNNLAIALVQAGRVPEAIGHCEEALRLKPDNADARANLARLRTLQQTPGPGK